MLSSLQGKQKKFQDLVLRSWNLHFNYSISNPDFFHDIEITQDKI